MKAGPGSKIRAMAVLAMLAAASAVLMFLEFPLAALFPSFLKFDFSELPALIASFMFGPLAGAAVVLVKNLVNLTQTTSAGVGQLANVIVGVALVIPAGVVYRLRKTKGGAVWGMIVGIVVMAAAGAAANYWLTLPFYMTAMGIPAEAIIGMCQALIPAVDSLGDVILLSITPFNLLKGAVVSLITFFTYKRLSRVAR